MMLGIALSAERAQAAFPGKNGKIAFNNNGIYTVKANGNGRKRLRKDGFDPAWSPNGKKIAFVREIVKNNNRVRGRIYTMNANGGGLKRLTNPKARDQDPAWSPNGKKIVFTRQPDSGDSEIFRMNANGSNERRLTGNKTDDYQPAWSPKGSRVAYIGGASTDILTMDARSGQSRKRLTRTSGRAEYNPNWSPTGKRLAFGAIDYQTYDYALFKINSSGGGEKPLTDPSSTFGGDEPAWSPDGKKIVYRLASGVGWLGLDLTAAAGRGAPSVQAVEAAPRSAGRRGCLAALLCRAGSRSGRSSQMCHCEGRRQQHHQQQEQEV